MVILTVDPTEQNLQFSINTSILLCIYSFILIDKILFNQFYIETVYKKNYPIKHVFHLNRNLWIDTQFYKCYTSHIYT